jgi:hypothetical protein
VAVRFHPLCLTAPKTGRGSRHPFWFRCRNRFQSRGSSHEICAEWDGHCCRPGYCCASLGTNRSANDAIAQRAISDIGADGIDGVAYAEPPGKSAPSSRNATRERSRQRQHGQPTQRPGSRTQRRRRDERSARRDGRRASASLWWPKNRALRSAEPDLWHSRGWTTISQPTTPINVLGGQEGRRLQAVPLSF